MKTIALRFADNIAPEDGTIREHQKIIDTLGFVWYGKFGNRVSDKVRMTIMENKNPRILLIHSGTAKRYWMYIDEISDKKPDLNAIPAYYRNSTDRIKTWFKVLKIERAEKDIMKQCRVASSGNPLSSVSKYSMSPYFIINCESN